MKKLTLLLLLALTVSCSLEQRFEQVQVHFYPDDLQTLYVKYGNGKFGEQKNGEDFTIEHEEYILEGVKRARTAITSNKGFQIDYGYISTFNNIGAKGIEDDRLEMNWKKEGSSFSVDYETKETRVDFIEVTLHTDNDK